MWLSFVTTTLKVALPKFVNVAVPVASPLRVRAGEAVEEANDPLLSPSSRSAFRFETFVVDATVNGAVPSAMLNSTIASLAIVSVPEV